MYKQNTHFRTKFQNAEYLILITWGVLHREIILILEDKMLSHETLVEVRIIVKFQSQFKIKFITVQNLSPGEVIQSNS